MFSTKYIKMNLVLIGDIVSSRKIKDRGKVQQTLQQTVQNLNVKGKAQLASPYTVTIGDEFQAVFANADGIFYDILNVLKTLYPIKLRFSLSVGDILTDINPKEAIAMDGPAFYLARDNIESLKKQGYLLDLVMENERATKLSRLTLKLLSTMIALWKPNRFEIFEGIYNNKPVKTIAEELDISVQAVYKNIEEGELRLIIQTFTEIEQIINEQLS